MANTKPLYEAKGFRGKNNVADPARILPAGKGSFLAESRNADIDNALMAHRRSGFGAPVYPGAGIYSIFGNGPICLFVQGANLMRLNDDYTASLVRPDVGQARMNYVDVDGKIYYTNATVIGYFDGADHSFPDPGKTFKSPMKPGHLIEHFNGRLYVARDNQLWFSDPMALGRTDERRNFKQLSSYLTLLGAVDDGLFAADLNATYFLAGRDPAKSVLVKKADYGAVPGTMVKTTADKIGGYRGSGNVILWASETGICVGGNEGVFFNATQEHYRISGVKKGAAVIRNLGNYYQMLVTAWS